MNRTHICLAAAVAATASTLAGAHPGHGSGEASSLVHFLTAWDHVAMLGVAGLGAWLTIRGARSGKDGRNGP